jgi:hypothetical protein
MGNRFVWIAAAGLLTGYWLSGWAEERAATIGASVQQWAARAR